MRRRGGRATLAAFPRCAAVATGAPPVTLVWAIVIGFVAGVVAKLITPGDNKPSGFILTTLLGIAGAFVATGLGQWIGWYGPDERAGLIGAIVGAVIVLTVWGFIHSSLERSRRG
jgi:uncharacterized membrane protein YeaQ/YmgE (transglycosylase-associated protein family)